MYIVCLFISYASQLSFFLHFFLTYLLPYLSFPLRIDPLHFQAGCRKRRLNLGLVFLCCCSFLVIGECMLFCVRFRFSIPNQEIGLGKHLQNDLFYVEWDAKNHNSKISHLNHARNCQVNVLECEQCQLVSCSPPDLPQQRK